MVPLDQQTVSLEHAAQVANVDGHGKDDGGVVLSCYGVQGLQVSQLKGKIVEFLFYLTHDKSSKFLSNLADPPHS